MDELQRCAGNYMRLVNIKYRIIVGRKGETLEFVIGFHPSNFHHLAGLHKLIDVSHFQDIRRSDVLKKLLSGEYSMKDVENSKYIKKIRERIDLVAGLEDFLDSNEFIFRYDSHKNKGSRIKADFLLQSKKNEREAYLFLVKRSPDGSECACGSMFFRTGKDYAKGQERFTLLYKEKINLMTGESIVQYDKMAPKRCE